MVYSLFVLAVVNPSVTIVSVEALSLPCLPIKRFNFSRPLLIFFGKSIVSMFLLINLRRVTITILIISAKPSSESRSSFFRSSKFDSITALKIVRNLLSSCSSMSISGGFFSENAAYGFVFYFYLFKKFKNFSIIFA